MSDAWYRAVLAGWFIFAYFWPWAEPRWYHPYFDGAYLAAAAYFGAEVPSPS